MKFIRNPAQKKEIPFATLSSQFMCLKGLTQLWKSRRIYPKYMPKCSVGSTDYVCNFSPKILSNVEDIDVWNFRQKRFMWRHFGGVKQKLRIWQRTFHAIPALQIQFCLLFNRSTNIQGWQNLVNRIYEATCDETSQVNESYVKEWGLIILDTCQLWSQIFSRRGNLGVLTDTVRCFYDQHGTWLS